MKYLLQLLILNILLLPLGINQLFAMNGDKVSVYDVVLPDLKAGVDHVFREEFLQAEKVYDKIITQYPDHAIGYFALASLFNVQNDIYETTYFIDQTVFNFTKVKQITDNFILKNELLIDEEDKSISKKLSLYYYLRGSIKLNESYIKAKHGNFFSAFLNALDGIDDIESSIKINPNFIEPRFLLGSYIFFKNKLHSLVFDTREYGIGLIKEVINDKKNINRYFALSVLANVYIDKKEYELANNSILKGLDRYPNSRIFLFIYANSMFKAEKYGESIKIYEQIEKIIAEKNPEEFKDGFNSIYCSYRKIVAFYRLKDFRKTKELLKEFNYMKENFKFDNEYVLSRLDDIFDEIEDIGEDIL